MSLLLCLHLLKYSTNLKLNYHFVESTYRCLAAPFSRLTAFPSQSLWPPYPVRIRLASVACCDVTGHDGRLPWAPKSQAHLNARQSHLPPFILPVDQLWTLGVLDFDGFCYLAFRGISSIHSSNLHLIVLQLCSLSMSLFTVHYKRALFILLHNTFHMLSSSRKTIP